MPAAVRDDHLHLDHDTVLRRTTLSAATDSRLGQFLEALAEVWDPEPLESSLRMPAAHFADADLAGQFEAGLKRDLWAAAIERSLMPLAAPVAVWLAIPDIAGKLPGAEVAAEAAARPSSFTVEPGTALPTGTAACCVVTMQVVPLPRPFAP